MTTQIEAPKDNLARVATDPKFKHHRIVPMLAQHDGQELNLPMVVLTSRENSEVEAKAYSDTIKLFGEKPPKRGEMGEEQWDELYSAQKNAWLIFYSVRLPNDLTKKWFMSKQHVEDQYNVAEAGILANNYVTVVLTQPHLTTVDFTKPNAFQALIDQIKEMGEKSDFFLNGITTHSVNQLIRFLVSHHEKCPICNGSSGTP